MSDCPADMSAIHAWQDSIEGRRCMNCGTIVTARHTPSATRQARAIRGHELRADDGPVGGEAEERPAIFSRRRFWALINGEEKWTASEAAIVADLLRLPPE